MEGGNWVCNLCGAKNQAPPSLHSMAYNAAQYPELSKGTVDYAVSKEYSVRPPQEPIAVFVLDMSSAALMRGSFQVALQQLKVLVARIPGEERARVGFVTFGETVEYYDLSSASSVPKTIIMSDVDEPFCPLHSSAWLVNPTQAADRLSALFEYLWQRCAEQEALLRNGRAPVPSGSASIAAVYSVFDGLRTSGGRIVAFFGGMPSLGLGKLNNREGNGGLYGRPNESDLIRAATTDTFYKVFATKCAEAYVCVDYVCLTDEYLDLAAMAQVPNTTGGSILRFPDFQGASASSRTSLFQSLARMLTRHVALEAVLKVRCSTGLRVVKYEGVGLQRSVGSELNAAIMDADKSCIVTIEHDGAEIKQGAEGYIQAAVLYTSANGQRLVRTINVAFPYSTALADVFRHSDMHALVATLARGAVAMMATKSVGDVQKHLTKSAVNTLHAYRRNCASNSAPGQLILPEALKYLPLLTLCILRARCPRKYRKSIATSDVAR